MDVNVINEQGFVRRELLGLEYVLEERRFRLSGTHLARGVDGGEGLEAAGEAIPPDALVREVRVGHGDNTDPLERDVPLDPFNLSVDADIDRIPAVDQLIDSQVQAELLAEVAADLSLGHAADLELFPCVVHHQLPGQDTGIYARRARPLRGGEVERVVDEDSAEITENRFDRHDPPTQCMDGLVSDNPSMPPTVPADTGRGLP
ncbi:MAG TPA: hypothetical protein VG455_07745 [Acidimicrobiales bacterium]|nr:hypothetical protein [Acidimicrobiales bacterium]